MGIWSSTKSRRVLDALFRIGLKLKREKGSNKILTKEGFEDFVFAFHDKEEIGPKMLARISKHTNLKPDNL
ncbi:MAG: type II toxin-antitoxin system HicA family toxin [Candidatus Kapabacteria bacterium]|nr:type II toxin-antitoxin system HicA family toxin [Candidatus Kapabacteria bacterium]